MWFSELDKLLKIDMNTGIVYHVIGNYKFGDDYKANSIDYVNKDYDIYDGPLIINSYNNNKIEVDLVIKQDNFYDIGFVLEDNVYNMVTDLQFWDQTVPPNVFMERLIKQYTINSIIDTCTEEGFYTEHITTDMETGFTEIVVSRYKDK